MLCILHDSAQEPALTRRATGSLCRCAECGDAYPEELSQCPSCGSVRQVEEETISSVIGDLAGWSIELVVDVLHKARQLGRWDDVERMLRRSRTTVERLVNEFRGPSWTAWPSQPPCLRLCATHRTGPTGS